MFLQAHDRAISAMSYGPEENSHVANYRKASSKFPLSLDRKNWSEVEKKDLQKGIRQQFQEMVLQSSVDESRYLHSFLSFMMSCHSHTLVCFVK